MFVPITIGSNIAALTAQRRLNDATDRVARVSEKLSSGQRINRAADDAAGLAIADSLRTDSRVFSQAIRNANDGVSFLNIADGALNQLSDITMRQKELAEQSANGVYSLTQRKALNNETNALVDEWNRITASTSFNGRQIFDTSTGELRLQLGYGVQGSIGLALNSSLARTVGDGTFHDQSVIAVGTVAYDAVSVDLNRDGKLDIIDGEFGSLGVRLGNGDGTFQSKVAYAVSNSAFQVQLADLNNDGKMDVVAGNQTTGQDINVFIGNGDGTLQAKVDYSSGTAASNATGMAIADFNGDGFLDLAGAAYQNSSPGRLGFLLLGSGNGTFQSATTFDTTGDVVEAVAGDLNGDGISDLILGCEGNGSNRVYLGSRQGRFSQSQNLGNDAQSLALNDLNNDGVLDLTTQWFNEFRVYQGNGDGTFKTSTLKTVGPSQVQEVELTDVNGDGNQDAIISTGIGGSSVSILLGDGQGNFGAATTFGSLSDSSRGMTVGDFNGDGSQDIVIADYTSSNLQVLLGNTRSTTSIAKMYLLTQGDSRAAIDTLNAQLNRINSERGKLGAFQSRVAVAINNLSSMRENSLGAESRIRDADVAKESGEYTRLQILQQAGAAVLAQANQLPALALQLLR